MQPMTALSPAATLPPLRDELHIHPAGNNRDGSPAWHLADPVRNLFFRLGWLEFEMVRRWALGSAPQIAEAISRETTLTVEEEDVTLFLRFCNSSSCYATAALNLAPAVETHSAWLSVYSPAADSPGKSPAPLLPWVCWLFSVPFLLVTLLAALSGLVLAARQWDSVQAALHGALSWNGALAFAVALIFSKCWHELGHAFVATRHGVRVGHMGVALLVLWPMAYTDTGELEAVPLAAPAGDCQRRDRGRTDAGRLGDAVLELCAGRKRQNALFFLATTAWVMTVAVNASPFMRFDGYYILSDWLDYPALHERAGNWAKRWMRGHLLGLDDPLPDNVSPAFSRFLTLFAFATWIYRLTLFIGIALVVYHAFFKALGLVLFFIEIITFVVHPCFVN
jgi:putative peptide zinc metalloprotease protein